MSYYVIKGPADNRQYLGAQVCNGTDFGCPQWRGTRAEANKFPDPESAWKWLDLVQKKHPDGWYQGRVVRVNTLRDWQAERAQLRRDRDLWRAMAELRKSSELPSEEGE